MVVAWRIAPRPDHRAAVLVSIQQIRRSAILDKSKDLQLNVTLKPAWWHRRLLLDNQGTSMVYD